MARRRFQRGSVRLRGNVWIGRYLEDVLENGVIKRKHRTIALSTARGPDGKTVTERQARRFLQPFLDKVNAASSQPDRLKKMILFSAFVAKWEASVLNHKKPSTQLSIRGHIRNTLIPAFGATEVRAIHTEDVQSLLSRLVAKVAPKTVRNVKSTISMMWRMAKAWGYAEHDVTSDLDLPRVLRPKQPFLTALQMGRIIAAAAEPEATFYWLAGETGLRAGELSGLSIGDVDAHNRLLSVERSVWRGAFQSPKTESAVRTIALSPPLAERLAKQLERQAGKDTTLLFSSRKGTPWDANLLVKRKFHPLLKRLALSRCGLHAFRHGNATLMDGLGVPLKIKQYRLGHSRSGDLTTDVYTHFQPGDDCKVAAQIGTVLSREVANSLPLTCPHEEGPPEHNQEALVLSRK